MSWQPIRYRDFYDFPRIFVTTHDGKQFLFDCPFDDELDDYADSYRVYELPPNLERDLQGPWERLPERALGELGEIPVTEVQFDETRRKFINTSVLQELLSHQDPQTTRVA